MAELNIGIIGCGRMGRERARCAQALGARIRIVFDPDHTRSADLTTKYGGRVGQSVEECFHLGLDAILLCTAPGTRRPAEILCLENRVPFLVEKPVSTSAAQCRDLVERLQQQPVINAVGYMNRYRSSVQQAREILRHAEIIGLSAHWICKPYNVPWWKDDQYSGGPHNDQATHLFDLSRLLVGEITEIQARFQGTATVATILRFETDAVGTTLYSCDGHSKDIGIRIFTQRGTIALTGWDFRMTENTITAILADACEEDIFLSETSAFFEAVHSGRKDLIQSDFLDAVRTQRVLDAARQSWECRRSVPVFPNGSLGSGA
ncbi:MAG: Gfo/Idh/MocA family oxidoreductase [Acidobacteriaceae bacterium]|nr:Gfo/Idh/MocA family oxidoreductase [Acidobacteriaceae bacterium]